MMTKTDIVQKVLSKLESGYVKEAGVNLTDHFVFEGDLPRPLSKDAFLDLNRRLFDALPDWSYHMKDFREDGSTVSFTVQITGTNTGILDVPTLGVIAQPATGIRVQMPAEEGTAVFDGDRIARLKFHGGKGIKGLLDRLGAIPGPKVPA